MMTPSYLSREDGDRLLRFFTRKSKTVGVELDIYVPSDDHPIGRGAYGDLDLKIRITLHGDKPIYVNKGRALNEFENTANGPVFTFVDKQTGKPGFALTLDTWFIDDLEARKALAAVNHEELKESDFVILKPGRDNAIEIPAKVDVRGLLGDDLHQWRHKKLQLKVLEDERFRDVPFDQNRHGLTMPVPLLRASRSRPSSLVLRMSFFLLQPERMVMCNVVNI
ncbi:hypothetical protein LTR41_007020 [Exophiala xenobiotica]|nr:hypothetical protein LTR41_007020 [Exophiala xenobiotica]